MNMALNQTCLENTHVYRSTHWRRNGYSCSSGKQCTVLIWSFTTPGEIIR